MGSLDSGGGSRTEGDDDLASMDQNDDVDDDYYDYYYYWNLFTHDISHHCLLVMLDEVYSPVESARARVNQAFIIIRVPGATRSSPGSASAILAINLSPPPPPPSFNINANMVPEMLSGPPDGNRLVWRKSFNNTNQATNRARTESDLGHPLHASPRIFWRLSSSSIIFFIQLVQCSSSKSKRIHLFSVILLASLFLLLVPCSLDGYDHS